MNENLQRYQKNKQELTEILEETIRIFQEMGDDAKVQRLSEFKEKVQSDNFKVLVMGEFKRGKSTFINALLKEKVLPAYSKPCTAVINEIKYGDTPNAIICFKKGIETLPDGLAPEIVSYIQRFQGQDEIPELEVPFDELEQYVTIQDPGKDQEQSVAESPFERAVITYPLDLCRDGVEIIDSPGLNEQKTRTTLTTDYAEHVDAIIFVLLCKPLGSESEMKCIDNLGFAGHKSIFFICNAFDDIDDEDRDDIKKYAVEKLSAKSDLGDKGIYFISSKNALKARTSLDSGNPDSPFYEDEMAFEEMEKALTRFLVEDKGRIKLQRPAENIANELTKSLPAEIKSRTDAMNRKASDVLAEYEKSQEELNDLEENTKSQLENLRGKAESVQHQIEKEIRQFLGTIVESIPGWVQGYEPEASLGIIFTSKGDIENVVNEIVEHVKDQLEAEKDSWRNGLLKERIDSLMVEFKDRAENTISRFKENLKGLSDFSDMMDNDSEAGLDDIYTSCSIEPNFLIDIVTTTVPSLLLGVGAALLGLFNPFIMIPVLLGVGGISRLIGKETKMDKIKKEVAKELQSTIREAAFSHELENSSDQLRSKLDSKIDEIEDALMQQIEIIRNNSEKKKEASELSQQEADALKAKFADILERADEINRRNQDFLQDLSNDTII